MKSFFSGLSLISLSVLFPFIPYLWELAPRTKLWGEYKVWYYDDWQGAIFTVCITAMPFIIGLVCLLSIKPKRNLPLTFFFIVALYVTGWQLWSAIWPYKEINPTDLLLYLGAITGITGIILATKLVTGPTEREKKEELIRAIDQLTTEDLPQLFLCLHDLEMTAEEMKETDFASAWKNVIKKDVRYGKLGMEETIRKFIQLKRSTTQMHH